VTTELDRLLDVAAEVIEACALDAALIGGCARNAFAPPRATKDVDLVARLSPEAYAQLVGHLRARGFAPINAVTSELGDPVPDITIFREASGGRIDVLASKTEFEDQALSRATRSGRLRVVSVEDLLVYKLIAGRPRDLADVEEIARTQIRAGRTIDWSHVEKWLAEWGEVDRLAQLRRELESG
jgi:hypothetical protein